MKTCISLLCLFSISTIGAAQKTYSGDIAEIIYQKCSSCHRSGEIGPMSLSNYDEVKSWGTMIEYVTKEKIMPPWQPDPSFSKFLGENYLTDEEIASIQEWVADGMPRGNASEEPSFPSFPSGSLLGTPDLVLEMEEAWIHEGNNKDDYRYFVLPTNLPEDKIIKAVEFRPGNPKIVHHALVFEDQSGKAAANDMATPEYGFNGFGSFTGGDVAETLNQKQFPGYVPGQKPIRYPDGLGQILHAGADVVVQLHYAPWPVDESDKSSINIFFMNESEEEFEREMEGHIMVPLPNVIGELFVIPANTTPTFHGTYEVEKDISLVTISPHMHLLGRDWEVWMERPNGDIVNLIKIPNWDFNWQGSYSFPKYIVAPKGTIIHAVASYDNTTDNPNNPSNPPQFVTWGEGTTDEMYYLPIGFVDYQNGDQNIYFEELDTSVPEIDITSEFYLHPIFPNPVHENSMIKFTVEHGQALSVRLFDINGKVIRNIRQGEFFNSGEHSILFSTKNLSTGTYFLQVSGRNLMMNQKFVKG